MKTHAPLLVTQGMFRGQPWLGGLVRLRGRKRKAVVTSDYVEIGGRRVEGGVAVSPALQNIRFWNVEELEMVQPNAIPGGKNER